MTMAAQDLILWGSPASPYVRMVMIAAHELGAADDLDYRKVTPETIIDAVSPHNSLAQIPTLVTANGPVYDSRTILYWLDDHYGPSLIPRDPEQHAALMSRFATATGLIDAANLTRNLALQPEGEQPHRFIKRLTARKERALDRLETDAGGTEFMADRIATASALGYLDYRFGDEDWRGSRPALAGWYEAVSDRPSVAATAHPAN